MLLRLADRRDVVARFLQEGQHTARAAEVAGADDEERRPFGHDGGHLGEPVGIAAVDEAVEVFGARVARRVCLRLGQADHAFDVLPLIEGGEAVGLFGVPLDVVDEAHQLLGLPFHRLTSEEHVDLEVERFEAAHLFPGRLRRGLEIGVELFHRVETGMALDVEHRGQVRHERRRAKLCQLRQGEPDAHDGRGHGVGLGIVGGGQDVFQRLPAGQGHGRLQALHACGVGHGGHLDFAAHLGGGFHGVVEAGNAVLDGKGREVVRPEDVRRGAEVFARDFPQQLGLHTRPSRHDEEGERK